MILYILSLDKHLDWVELSKYLHFVSYERCKKIEKYVDVGRKIISVLTELLLRFSLIKNFDLEQKKIKFRYNKYGKPMILNKKNLHFSISHSNSTISVLINDSPVGLDVEFCRKVNFNIAKRFFTIDEYKTILSNKDPNKMFFKIWTQKEAHIKLLGINFSKLLKTPKQKIDSEIFYHCFDFQSHIISIACLNAKTKIKIKYISLIEILSVFKIDEGLFPNLNL